MKHNIFTTDMLLELSKTIIDDNIFIDLNTFNDEMLISQVVRFFNKHDRKFTKTMIQNYVRVGLLPPPIEKRYYTKNHLILLTFIDNLKSTYSLDEIKHILTPILKDPTTFEDDIIEVGDLYKEHIKLYKKSLENWETLLPDTLKDINSILKDKKVDDSDMEIGGAFLMVLILMSQTIALKTLSKLITEKYLT